MKEPAGATGRYGMGVRPCELAFHRGLQLTAMYLAVLRQCCEWHRKTQPSDLQDLKMIMRIWRGKVPKDKAATYLTSLRAIGLKDYANTPRNLGA